ncbi:branched-chain amino acid ABC transporter permease [Microbacterium sp. X-17]|uniref:branched-chain amino acid ABC transporter permease n=1 Tax=Microbacterium sp. X-17 TaxID=3144404 RepID=UPI0031F5765E
MSARLVFPLASIVAVVGVTVLLPLILPSFSITLLSMWIPFVLLALAVDIMWGENRIVSFGHGVFFALGGYVAGVILRGHTQDSSSANLALLNGGADGSDPVHAMLGTLADVRIGGLSVAPLIAPLVLCGLLGWLIGVSIFRLNDPELYAPLVTLGVGVIATAAFLRVPLFGGSNGLSGIPSLVSSGGVVSTYAINAALVTVLFVGYWIFRRRRSGLLWRASGDDPLRLEALGFRVAGRRALGFGVSAALAGLAGALYASAAGYVSADLAAVGFSVQALVWVAVGGPGKLFGPILGVLLLQSGQQALSQQLAGVWPLVLGGLLLVLVLAAPTGVSGLVGDLATRVAERNEARGAYSRNR